MNIRVDLNTSIKDGTEVVFRSPVDCSQITGLIVYYRGADGNTTSKEFMLADANGNNVGDIDHLFAEDVVVKVILDVTKGMAFVQNADTNAYLESRFDGIIDKLCPSFTESGAVVACEPFEGTPLEVVSKITPQQSGSGDPSPNNVRPIVGCESVNLTRCGKNLLPYPYYETTRTTNGLTFTDNGDGTITVNGTASATTYFFVKPLAHPMKLQKGQQYTVTGVPSNIGTSKCYFCIRDTSYAQIAMDTGKGATITAEYTDYYSYIYVYANATLENVVFKPQLEIGAVATDFECYREGEEFTFDLGQTAIGGTLNWKTGELTLDKEILTFTGNEKWTHSTPKDGYCRIQHSSRSIFTKDTCVCSHYKMYPNYNDTYTFPFIRANDGSGNWIYEGKQDGGYFASADDFKAFLAEQYAAGTPVQAVCKKDTPITVQLTSQEILALSGVNTLYSDTGDTTVTGKADPVKVIENLTNAIIALGGNV